MAYFNTCSICGSNLDPGEKCDCGVLTAKNQKSNQTPKAQANNSDSGLYLMREWLKNAPKSRVCKCQKILKTGQPKLKHKN